MLDDDRGVGDDAGHQGLAVRKLDVLPHSPFVLVTRIGGLERIESSADRHDQIGEVLQLHVAGARPHIDAIAGVMAHALRRDVAQRVVQHLDAPTRPISCRVDALVGREHVVHGEARIVDLELKPRCGEDMLVVGLVVPVLHQPGAARRRYRRHEDIDGVAPGQCRRQIVEILLQR